MALKSLLQFPIFAPPNPTHHRPSTEVRFSRWNSATNADKFVKRFESADKIANTHDNDTGTTANQTFRSTGRASSPSRSSINGNKSKYSRTHTKTHPAFRRISKAVRLPTDDEKVETAVKVSEDGVSYVLPDAPFAFQHSYTETPKVKPVGLREPRVAPFGPSTMPRPWTGRKPLPSGKKVDFDSFRLPPAGKKGVKPVQAPGPFLPGSGPKYVMSREEVLGEPLTKDEVAEMVIACRKTRRQLNMGRDGLTHNMLDNIHALWKRKRVCKIKCLGVCTVDMDNVRKQVEEKTGGKIIYSKGGIIYLFRGRNYNYKTRPLFPLMLWKPATPIYPRLIPRIPEGLTLEEANEMRTKGRNLIPITKLGKNGVYCDLVKHVKEAFEACELVRINCQEMNPSDFRKIGGKLKDLVPCVLISFEREHILIWRGRDWKSSLTTRVDDSGAKNSAADSALSIAPRVEGQAVTALTIPKSEVLTCLQTLDSSTSPCFSEDVKVAGAEGTRIEAKDKLPELNEMSSPVFGSLSNTTDVCLNSEADGPISTATHVERQKEIASPIPLSDGLTSLKILSSSTSPVCNGDMEVVGVEGTNIEALNHLPEENDTSSRVGHSVLNTTEVNGSKTPSTLNGYDDDPSEGSTENHGSKFILHTTSSNNDEATGTPLGVDISIETASDATILEKPSSVVSPTCNELRDSSEMLQNLDDPTRLSSPWTEGVIVLWKDAIERGRATVLDDSSLDADVVYRRAVALSQSAPPGPVFRNRHRKVAVLELEKPKTEDLEVREVVMVSEKEGRQKTRSINRQLKGIKGEYLNVAPQGSLRVDELAKLLA